MRRPFLLAALCFASLIAACSGGSAEQPEPTTVPGGTPTTVAGTATATATPTEASETPSPTPTTTSEAPTPEPPTPQAQTPQAPTPAPTTGGGTTPPTVVVLPPTPTPPPASANPMSATVGAAGTARFVWSPSKVTIAVGGTVTWTWSEPVQPHNIVGNNFPLGPTDFKKADTVSHTFTSAGTYTFTCETHPDTMKGTVVVQ